MSSFRPWRALLLLWSLAGLFLLGCGPAGKAPPSPTSSADGYLFCFWNVENFFDDSVYGYSREPDKSFDQWFANDKAALAQKIENLCKVLLGLNGGRGPDI